MREGDLTWVHVQKPTTSEAIFLAQRFPNFHPLNLEDMLTRHRPKIDEYPDHLFVVLEFPIHDPVTREITPCVLDAFIGKDFLVTVDLCGRFNSVVRFMKSCQENAEKKGDFLSGGPGYLLYRIIDLLVDRRMEMVSNIGEKMQALEDKIFSARAQTLVKEISTLRRDILYFWQIMWPMRDVVRNLEAKILRYTRIDTRAYFSDLHDHLNNIWNALVEYKEIIESLNDTYNSMATYRINDVLRVLTIIMTIGTILTVVVGWFGMNIPLGPLGSDPGGHALAGFLIFLVSALIAVIMLYYFWRKGWL